MNRYPFYVEKRKTIILMPLPIDSTIIMRKINYGEYFTQPRASAAGEQTPQKTLPSSEIDPYLLSQFYHCASHLLPLVGIDIPFM